MEQYECIVVGAGPAGATFARQAALKGLRVLILEKESLPRYKVCGGGLTPAVKKLLDFDYSSTIERKVSGVAFISGDDSDIIRYPDGMPIDMVTRSEFDHFLVKQAVSAGATLREATSVAKIEESADSVAIQTKTGETFSARVAVGADGARSIVARSAGLARNYVGVALECELYPHDPGALEEFGQYSIFGFGFIPGKNGYGWVFPKKDHFSVGIGVDGPNMPGLVSIYRSFVKRFEFLADARENVRRGWFLPYCGKSETVNTRRICLVGDSAHLVDPFSGEGIYPAILSGSIAADVVTDELGKKGHLSRRYTREIKKRITADFMYGRWCSAIFYRAPSYFYKKNRVIQALTRLSRKDIRYKDVLNELRKTRRT